MRMGSNKDSSKENDKPTTGIRSFLNVFRPIRELFHTRPKTSTPISNPIFRSSSAIGHPHLQSLATNNTLNNNNQNNNTNINHHNTNNNSHGATNTRPRSNLGHTIHSINGMSNHNNNINQHNNILNSTNNSNNSYGGDSLTALSSSGDMLSTAVPTPIHHQHLNNVAHHRFTPIVNGHSTFNGLANNTIMTSGTMEDINGSLISGIGSMGGGAGVCGGGMDGINGTNGGYTGAASDEVGRFSRNAQARMSLPIMQQNKMRRQAYNQLQRRGQQVARSMGFIYLQHKGETKQANLPNELTTIDTIRALFVCAFPHMLTMEFMCQPNIKIYIYSPSCNIFYELSDIEEVRHESVLRIHYSDPLLPIALPSQVSLASMAAGTLPSLHAHHYSTLHRLPPRPAPQLPPQPGSQSSLGQPMSQSQHQHQAHIMQQMQQMPPTVHQMMNTASLASQLSQIPPPKPRRMIPASYTIHRLNSAQQ